jgi:hypothetical protein
MGFCEKRDHKIRGFVNFTLIVMRTERHQETRLKPSRRWQGSHRVSATRAEGSRRRACIICASPRCKAYAQGAELPMAEDMVQSNGDTTASMHATSMVSGVDSIRVHEPSKSTA